MERCERLSVTRPDRANMIIGTDADGSGLPKVVDSTARDQIIPL